MTHWRRCRRVLSSSCHFLRVDIAIVASTATFLSSAPASAYSYGSVISDPCHERITSHALRSVRGTFATAQPLPSSGDDEALIHDLPFELDGDMRDIGAAALLVGVRDNDLKGRFGTESTDLASVHGNPDGQQEHCLRRATQQEPTGSEAALEECRRFIRGAAIHAIDDGLDAAGMPDPGRRTYVKVYLSFAGKVAATLPIFYVYMGEALHTLQDSFTHTFRTPDHRKVTVVLNWLDFVGAELDERHDGPPHMVPLDQCADVDDFRKRRMAMASQASVELLTAAVDPAKAREEKIAAIDQVLDSYLTFQPGCTFDTRWCDAPENRYRIDEGCGCRIGAQRGERSA
jgi:hypothetical protein